MKRLAISNLKGGVGKTTIAVNLGAALAAQGLRVLLIDTDSQGHVGIGLGLKHNTGLWDLMITGVTPAEVTYQITDRFHVIPSDKRTGAIEQQLVSTINREAVLSKRLEMIKGYDLVLVDTAPSLSLILQNAIVYTRNIFIPISMDYLSVVGAMQSLELARLIYQEMGLGYKIFGVVPTFVDKRLSITETVLAHIDRVFRKEGIRVFPPIRIDTNIQKASVKHQAILDYEPKSRGAEDFRELAKEVSKVNDRAKAGKSSAKFRARVNA